jgi:hypothetical protein
MFKIVSYIRTPVLWNLFKVIAMSVRQSNEILTVLHFFSSNRHGSLCRQHGSLSDYLQRSEPTYAKFPMYIGTQFGWSTCPLVFGCWLLDQVIYHELRKKCILSENSAFCDCSA